MMKDDGKENRGFGFVGFVDPISAQRGIAGMHNLLLDPEDMSKRMQVRVKKGDEKAGDECREALAMKDPYHPGYGNAATSSAPPPSAPTVLRLVGAGEGVWQGSAYLATGATADRVPIEPRRETSRGAEVGARRGRPTRTTPKAHT